MSNELAQKIRLYMQDQLSPQERETLFAELAACNPEEWEALHEQVSPGWVTQQSMQEDKRDAILKTILVAGDLYYEEAPAPAKLVYMNRWRKWVGVAAVLLLVASGLYWWKQTADEAGSKVQVQEAESILPGRAGAILTLADGAQVSLDSLQEGELVLQGGVQAKVVNGTLVYEGVGEEVVFHTMSTPKGRQFQLMLPDGSRVWLNAASVIRYPTAFTGDERRVAIQGEAYFEVKKGASPFVVEVDRRAEVMVLGTHFNVNGYNNESSIRTTLLEGSVRMVSNGNAVTIRPGQQAQLGKALRVEENVDLDQVMAWKNGVFNFEGAGLQEVLRQLERWYDIEVVYEKGVPDIEFVGKMTKNISLNDLLVILEKSKVHFRLEGRKLIVLP